MKITKLILHKYRRFFLSQVETFILEPESNIMLITWGNGKGKSSLLSQLNPLPGNIKKDFREGGYKELHCEHRGNKYVLLSSGNRHSFLFNGIELNQAGLIKTQLELVKEHFTITPAIAEVMLSKVRWSNMSSAVRKQWFSELSPVDFTYPIGVYNGLKSRLRDITGGIKILEGEIVKLASKSKSDEDMNKLLADRDLFKSAIEHALKLYDHTTDLTKRDVLPLIDSMSKQLSFLLSKSPISNNEDVYKSKINNLPIKIKSLTNTISSLTKEIELIDEAQLMTPDEVLKNNRLRAVELYNELKSFGIWYKLKRMSRDFLDLHPKLLDVIDPLFQLERLETTDENLLEDINKLKILNETFDIAKRKEAMVSGEIESFKQYDNDDDIVKCPNCNHQFHNHLDVNKYDKLKKVKEVLEVEINNLKKQIEEMNNTIRIKTEIKNSIVMFFKLLRIPSCESIYDELKKSIDYNTSVYFITNTLYSLKMRYEYIQDLFKEFDALRYANKVNLNINRRLLSQKVNEKSIERKKIELELEKVIIKRDKLIKLLNIYNNDYKVFTNIISCRDKLNDLFKELDNCVVKESIRLYNVFLSDTIKELKSYLVDIEQEYNDAKLVKDKILSNEKTIDELKEKARLVELVVDKLSPSDGLIAKSINNFLNVYIKEMNNIINTVWSYPLQILPCSICDGNDLDYKFAVKVDNKEVIEDISKLSESQKEIVDLAYKIVFMKYIGMSDAPLYLDEFGITMDANHRNTAYNMIERIFSSNFEQIYLVSHFDSMYGRFSSGQIVNLEDRYGI